MLTTHTGYTARSNTSRGDTLYPLHTGSVLLDLAHAQRAELLAASRDRRRANLAHRFTSKRTAPAPKRPWWWGLARSHRAA
jgi:hypothetical protein